MREAARAWGREGWLQDCSKPFQTLSFEGPFPLWETETLEDMDFSLFVPSPIKSKTL